MSKIRVEPDAGEPASAESSALLQPPRSVVTCEVEGLETHDEIRSHNTRIRRCWRAVTYAFSFGNAQRTNRQLAYFSLLLLMLAVGAYLALSIMQPSVSPGLNDIRIVLLADAHLIGPQYKIGGESNDVDNDSILKTADRLQDAQRKVPGQGCERVTDIRRGKGQVPRKPPPPSR